MTQEQFAVRKERAERDVFVITAVEEGWRVRSARNPSRFYLVPGGGANLKCACPDFQTHAAQDPTWQCKHVLAVLAHQAKLCGREPESEHELAEERAAIQTESPEQALPANGEATASQMLIKRSISPDGRIDSMSIEFALPLAEATVTEISGIAPPKHSSSRPRSSRNSRRANQSQAQKANGAVFARLLDVGVMNGQYGERFYLNFEVNGRRARLFGTAAQIARAISTVGEKLYATDIEPGLRVDLPCRVLTQESSDGRYLNVTRVLPLRQQANGGTSQ